MLCDRWADRHRIIASKDAAEPGPWRTDRVAYMRRPMRLACHPLVRQVTFETATQLSKSETLETIKLCLIAGMHERGTLLAMYPTEDMAVQFNRDRFLPNVRACGPAREKLGASPHDAKNLKIDFDDWVVWYAGSNSETGKVGRSVRVLVLDEVDKFKPGWENIFDRTKAWPDYKWILASSPTLEGAGIHEQWKRGTRERYYVPCPHCGLYQKLVFGTPGRPGGLSWEGGSRAEPADAKATAHYVCRGCEGRIHDWHKPEMNRAGVWVPENRGGGDDRPIDRDDVERARERDAAAEEHEYGCEAAPAEHVSFQISSLYSPFGAATFGHMAEAFVKLRGQVTQEFVNGWLGEEWTVANDRTEVAELRRLCIAAEHGGYRAGECQTGVLALTLAVDVQADRMYLEVRGWGERGEDTWLVDAVCLPRVKGNNLAELDGWLAGRSWKTLSGGALKLDSVIIDSGHFTDECYSAVRRLRAVGMKAFACKGQGINRSPMRVPYQLTQIDTWPEGSGKFAGKPMVPGCPLLVINSDYWKTRVLGQIKGRVVADEIEEGREIAKSPGREIAEGSGGAVPGFYLPENHEGSLEDYLDQVTSEQRVKTFGTKARPGPEQYAWAMRKGRTENHYWDCATYNFALADVRGVRRLAGTKARHAPTGTQGAGRDAGERGPSTREMLGG